MSFHVLLKTNRTNQRRSGHRYSIKWNLFSPPAKKKLCPNAVSPGNAVYIAWSSLIGLFIVGVIYRTIYSGQYIVLNKAHMPTFSRRCVYNRVCLYMKK